MIPLPRRHLIATAVLLLAATSCTSQPAAPTWVPGPGVPPVPTAQPLTWDARDELTAWVANGVSKGPISVEGEGTAAFIRVLTGAGYPPITPDSPSMQAVLRGPDLDPAVVLSGLTMRYRWTGGAGVHSGVRFFTQPVDPPWPLGYLEGGLASTALPGNWGESYFAHNDRAADSIRYVYFPLYSGPYDPPGQLDIDWIRIQR